MTEITLELLQELLKDDYPEVTIQHFEVAPGSQRGDNYTSMVYRVTLLGVRKLAEEGSEEPWEGSLVYKRLPDSNIRRETYKSDELFRNEVAFYTKIWPALSTFQAKWHINNPFSAIPKCYLAKNDCVVLDDLKQYGFVMPDRKKGLTIEECYVVMRQLARFHAISLAMKWHEPDKFYELLTHEESISEVFYIEDNIDYYRSYYNEAIESAITMVEEELKDSPSKDCYLDKLKSFCSEETFFQTMVEAVKPREPLSVIGHGDCWTNNFLFRYANGDIADMRIVDFQMVRYASPALDLVYILYLCLDRGQRTEHQVSLLDLYVDELHKRLLEMSATDSLFDSLLEGDKLHSLVLEEFRRCSHFGLGIALDMFPIMTCESAEAPNLYQAQEQETDTEHAVHSMQPVQTTNAACRRKMTDLVQELVDAELLE